jgi:hypothetical protein
MDDEGLDRFLRRKLRAAGRVYQRSQRAYREGRGGPADRDPDASADDADADPGAGAERYGLPTDDAGRARLVCRRHAERRVALVDVGGRPDCFEPGHPDCEGCAEDVRERVVETW